MASISMYDLRSHVKLPMIGIMVGPGGSFLVFDDWMMEKIDLISTDTQSETMIMNHVSILNKFPLCNAMLD